MESTIVETIQRWPKIGNSAGIKNGNDSSKTGPEQQCHLYPGGLYISGTTGWRENHSGPMWFIVVVVMGVTAAVCLGLF
jgi:hypothetical protein